MTPLHSPLQNLETANEPLPAPLFVVGNTYTRDQVADLIQMPLDRRGGNWNTGYDRWNDDFYLFCNVGAAGRTGHDYPNHWNGKFLIWYGKTGSKLTQPQIQSMLSGENQVHVFWRAKDRSPFTYAGEGKVHNVQETVPVQITWHFEQDPSQSKPFTSSPLAVRETNAPQFRRGPAPFQGEKTTFISDKPTFVYLMRLCGPISVVFPHLKNNHWIIKVGKSANVERRRRELNNGFPHGCTISWEIEAKRLYETDNDAFAAESELLEELRRKKYWLDGEFAMVPETDLPQI